MVFISHASEDVPLVRRISTALIARNVKPWWDSMKLRTGDQLTPRIFEAIDEASVFVVVMSPAAQRSDWVAKELSYALQRESDGGLRVLPVLVSPGGVLDELSDRIFVEILEDRVESAVEDLALEVERLLEPLPPSDRYQPVPGGPFLDWAFEAAQDELGRYRLSVDVVSHDPVENYSVLSQFEFTSGEPYPGFDSGHEQAGRLLGACAREFEQRPARLLLRSDDVERAELTVVDGAISFELRIRVRRLGRATTGTLLFNVGPLFSTISGELQDRGARERGTT